MKELGRGKYEKILKEEKEMDIFSLDILHGIHFTWANRLFTLLHPCGLGEADHSWNSGRWAQMVKSVQCGQLGMKLSRKKSCSELRNYQSNGVSYVNILKRKHNPQSCGIKSNLRRNIVQLCSRSQSTRDGWTSQTTGFNAPSSKQP